jgi:hypothetical protein
MWTKPSLAKKVKTYLKSNSSKKTGGMAQVVEQAQTWSLKPGA